MSQREAARAWGVGRITVQRAIASGKLSLTGDKQIDPAEMTRVFGVPKSRFEPAQTGPERPDGAIEMATKMGRLEAENAVLRDLVRRADAERDRALEMVRLLTHDGAPRRRWWPFGR